MRRSGGYTLIEVLVALVLLAVVLQIAYGFLAGSLDAEESIRRRLAVEQTADGLRDILLADLDLAALPQSEEEARKLKSPPLRLVRDGAGLAELQIAVRRDAAALGTASGAEPLPLVYHLREGSRGERLLVREGRWAETAARGLATLDLECRREGRWQPWVIDEGLKMPSVPPALRLVILFADGTHATRTLLVAGSIEL